MDRSTFILNVACREAENILLDQRLFYLNEKDFTAFKKSFKASIPNSDKLKQLLKLPAPWE